MARMIVRQDKGTSVVQQRPAEDIAGVNQTLIHRASKKHVFRDHPKLAIQDENPYFLCLRVKIAF